MQIHASIFRLPEPSQNTSTVDLWSMIAEDLRHELPDRYYFEGNRRFRVCVLDEVRASPDGKLLRFRTIEASIRRKKSNPTLIDISVGNLFSWASSSSPQAVNVAGETKYAVWIRNAAQIPLIHHVTLINQFIGDMQDAGWGVEESPCPPRVIPAPKVRNERRQFDINGQKLTQFLYAPIRVPKRTSLAIVVRGQSKFDTVAVKIQRAIESLFGGCWNPVIKYSDKLEGDAVNLLVLHISDDLEKNSELREELRLAEQSGILFKLARSETLNNTFATKNIAYELFNIAGGSVWEPVSALTPFCSFDAGHSVPDKRSRWVRIESSNEMRLNAIAVDTALAEHIPDGILNKLWGTKDNAILCRDGRLSRERQVFERRAKENDQAVIEVKKSPVAIMWRGNDELIDPTAFGDAVLDEHGDLLIQTTIQNVNDLIHPVRVSGGTDSIDFTATQFLHQHAIVGTSIYHMSRLPGSLYYADLISKLTDKGWTKAIGRGLYVPSIIP